MGILLRGFRKSGRMNFVRLRSMAVIGLVSVGATWVAAGSASALELGPVSLGPAISVKVPPTVVVGPVAVDTPAASATVSPTNGIGVDVPLPNAVGAGPLLPGLPQSVDVQVGPDGVVIAAPPATATTPLPVLGAPAPVSTPPAISAPSPAQDSLPWPSKASRASASSSSSSSGAPATRGVGDHVVPARPHRPSNAPAVDTQGAVNASLRPTEGGTWDLAREIASARTLWLALLLLGLVVCWAVRGFLRDALERGRVASPA